MREVSERGRESQAQGRDQRDPRVSVGGSVGMTYWDDLEQEELRSIERKEEARADEIEYRLSLAEVLALARNER